MNVPYTDWREWEFQIINKSFSDTQKVLNQWKHEYSLVILRFIANQDGCIVLIARKRHE